MVFNKERLFNNIYFLAKEQGIKIGELENAACVSKGYMARISSDGNKSIPSVEFVADVAEALGSSVDRLLYSDMEEATDSEAYISHFFDKLYRDTISNKIEWERDTIKDLLKNDASKYTKHPLFQDVEMSVLNGTDSDQNVEENTTISYKSMFHETGLCELEGDIVKTELADSEAKEAVLYITPIVYSYYYDGTACHEKEYDVCIIEAADNSTVSKKIKVCNTGTLSITLYNQIEKLYNKARDDASAGRIDKKARNIIDMFLDEDAIQH